MANLDTLCYWLSLSSAAWLAHLFPTSTAHDRPVHFVVLALIACSFVLPSAARSFPRLFHRGEGMAASSYRAVPLDDLEPANARPTLSPPSPTRAQHDGKVRITVVGLAVCLLSGRVELYRRISKATECTIDSVEVFLPFLLALYDAFRSQRSMWLQREEKPDNTIYQSYRATCVRYLMAPRTRYLLPLFLFSCGCYWTQELWRSSTSTYICPIVVGEARTVPLMQVAALFTDVGLAILAYETTPKDDGRGLSDDGRGLSARRCIVLWSSAMVATVSVWLVIATALYFFKPEYRIWLLFVEPPLDLATFVAIAAQAALFCVLAVSTLHCIITRGVLDMALYLTAVVALLPGVEFIWSRKNPFPPTSLSTTILSFTLVFGGRRAYRTIQNATGIADPLRPSRDAFLLAALVLLTLPAWRKKAYVHFHPIDMLIYDAQVHHQEYLQSVGNTTSLEATVSRYRQRYHRPPPPGFDVWFEYAKNKTAIVVDDFDQIYDDLLPFQAVSPADLRRQTWEMVSNPWNEISGISIRNGHAVVQENVLPTHRWMLEGVATLINSFAPHLPDMDLAFNLNDESRVAVPYPLLQHLRKQGRSREFAGESRWSENRAAGWQPVPEKPFEETIFGDMSFRNTFRKYGSVGCEPSSLARSSPHVWSKSHVCARCVASHSLGQFVANWSDAADICHQPDLAHLHGFYLSPAAFKTSYQLMPVFSQSKPRGYNDILYPSAWNYMDKVRYSPVAPTGTPGHEDYRPGFPDLPFAQKQNTLFWRGATSEGVSSGDHAWRGMTRQRLVHMANNLTTFTHDHFTVLLPNPADHAKYKYQTLPGPAVRELGLQTDIAIVDRIARCGGLGLHDCHDQEAEFGLVAPSDFQAHWGYRYLFDLDGAGFSGRFLPFLQSRSLPFKTALFREWYDSRLTAWLHFVPQDLRLHGVWSTLAYFAGVNGTMFGQNIWWAPHVKEGELIAEAGREWANKVLRKEDMELYFFRLLLEWGRLTDDRRDELGFSV